MALIPRSLIIFWIFFGVLCLLPLAAIGFKCSCSKKTKGQAGTCYHLHHWYSRHHLQYPYRV